jgi:Tol biopolymer transport system component
MWLIPAGGGEPVPFQEGFRFSGASIGSAPVWSPDGRHLIFCGRKADDPSSVDWWVAPADGGPAVRTGAMDALGLRSLIQAGFYFPDAWSGSHVYYSTGTTVEGVNIFRARIEEGSWRVAGPAERITSGSGVHFHISALLDGRLLYANVAWVSNIWSLEAEANSGRAGGSPAPISDDLLAKFDVSPSRDGSVLAYAAFGGLQKTRSEVRWKNLRRGEERIFPITGAFLGMTPRLSSDGGTLAYRDVIGGKTKTFIVASEDAAGREICESCSVLGFFPDPNFVLLREEGRKLLRLDVASGEKTLLLESRAGNILDPALSPDGRWAAFVLGKPDGRVAMVIAPIDGGADSEKDWVVLFDEGSYLGSPDWSPDGNRLYYLSERDGSCSIWTQGLDPRLKKPQGSSVEVYRSDYYRRNLNFPPGNGRLAAAADKLVFLLGESSSNIFLAAPKEE